MNYAIVHQCFVITLSRKIIVRKRALQTTNKFFILMYEHHAYYLEMNTNIIKHLNLRDF